MECPADIRLIVSQILLVGLLKIRGFAHEANSLAARAEADHLHNLPEVFGDYQHYMLPFYWDAMRTGYLYECGDPRATGYESLWAELEPLIERERAKLPADSPYAAKPADTPR